MSGESCRFGIFSKTAQIVKQCGWDWKTPFVFGRADLEDILLIKGSSKAFDHQIREELKRFGFVRAAEARKKIREDVYGLHFGRVDFTTTTQLLHGNAYFKKGQKGYDTVSYTHLTLPTSDLV